MRRREGFWGNAGEINGILPLPVPYSIVSPWRGRARFLAALEREERMAKTLHAKGFSPCRICKHINGSIQFSSGGWVWPSGYRHYIEAHNVRPSLAFQEFILGYEIS